MSMYRVRTVSSGWAGAPGYTTHYFEGPTATPDVFSTEGAGHAVDSVLSAWQLAHALWPTTFSFDVQKTVDLVDETTGELLGDYLVTGGGLDLGISGAGFGPTASGLCVRWTTAGIVNGHHVRGRSFLVPIAAGGDANGSPTATQLTIANTWADTTMTASPEFPQQVVWSRPVPGRAGSKHLVTGHVVADRFAVMRSRRQ